MDMNVPGRIHLSLTGYSSLVTGLIFLMLYKTKLAFISESKKFCF